MYRLLPNRTEIGNFGLFTSEKSNDFSYVMKSKIKPDSYLIIIWFCNIYLAKSISCDSMKKTNEKME